MLSNASSSTASPRTVCASCGVVAPQSGTVCKSCSAPIVRLTPPSASGGTYWVAAKCSFQCRSCSFAAPLDHLDVDGTVECMHCGTRQRFNVEGWREGLAFA